MELGACTTESFSPIHETNLYELQKEYTVNPNWILL